MTGLFGGTFDPPHNGHVALARGALRHFALERLVVMPTGQTPGKGQSTDPETRLRLAEAAFRELPRAEMSRFDIDRVQPAYSHETVRFASERWGEVIFLVGGDRLADFLTWERPDEILRYARLGVAARPGFSRAELERAVAGLYRPDRVAFFEIEELPISSSEIRRRLARGQSIHELVPPRVARLIADLDLYRSQGSAEPALDYDRSGKDLNRL